MAIQRAALWERVSTEEQAKFGYSIRTQIEALEEYCGNHEIKIVDHYTDEGVSAGKPWRKRPELVRLIDDVKTGKIDIILFTKLDRWFRNVQEYFKVQEILDTHHVEWKAIWEDYDTTSANGRLAITIFLAIAQNEREKTSERIKAVFDNKIKNGEACFGGSRPPMGYMKQEDSTGLMRLVKNPEDEELTLIFWRTLLHFQSLNAAIRKMTDLGVYRNEKSWKAMAASTLYIGEYKGNKEFCEPYISREDFEAYHSGKKIKKTPSGLHYYFRGMMRCPECGSSLCGSFKITSNGSKNKTYRCRMRGKGCNNQKAYAEKKIERQLLEQFDEFVGDTIAQATVEKERHKTRHKTDVKKLEEKLRRLNVVYMNGNLSDEEYFANANNIKEQIKEAQKETPPEPMDTTQLEALLNTDFRSLYEMLEDEEKQLFWQKLISEIVLDGDKKITSVKFK